MKQILVIPEKQHGFLYHYSLAKLMEVPHRHDELELNLVARGHGVYLVKERIVRLSSSSLLWLFPEQEHILIEQSADFEMWIWVFRQSFLHTQCTGSWSKALLENDPEGTWHRNLQPHQVDRLAALCMEIERTSDQLDWFNSGLGYLLFSAWSAFEAAEVPIVGGSVHPAVRAAARLICDEWDDRDLCELAEEVGLSPSRLSRLFKKQVGVSLSGFRNNQRIKRFITLYGRGQEKTMLDAALEAGFGSYPQFHRVFKHVMGMGPGEYKKLGFGLK